MEIVGQLAAVGAVLALLAACTWYLRKRGWAGPPQAGKTRGRRLEAVERLPLGPQHVLHLVRLGDRALLVASSPAGCGLLENCAWRDIEGPQEVLP